MNQEVGMAMKPTRGKAGGEEGPTAGGAEDLPERWSAQRKLELVLRRDRGGRANSLHRWPVQAGE